MALRFKTFKQIVEDWSTYVVAHSRLTDFNFGSVVRTIGEAVGLVLAQGYVQLQALLNLFSIDKASGEDLDVRALDFYETRLQPTKSTGAVNISDGALSAGDTAFSTLAAPVTGGASTSLQIQAADFAGFSSHVPGYVVIDRHKAGRERVQFTSVTGPDTLNLAAAVVNNHLASATVHLSTTGSDRSVPVGTQVRVPASLTQGAIVFETTTAQTLYDGDISLSNVPVQSVETGAANNVSAGLISEFVSPPFPTAEVTNIANTYGAQDLESDAAFRDRIRSKWQNLANATRDRILAATLEVSLPDTGQRVVSASLVEPVSPGVGILYIHDGSVPYTPSQASVEPVSDYISPAGAEIVIAFAEAGQKRGSLANWPLVNNTERLFVSKDAGTSTSVGAGTLADTAKSWTVNQWTGFLLKDESDKLYSITSNTATVLSISGGYTPASGRYAIINPAATAYPTGSKLTKTTDYVINNTNGQFELVTGLTAGHCVIAYHNGTIPAYGYYDELIQEVQKVVSGDPQDVETYPGVAAFGTVIEVAAPGTVVVPVVMNIAASPGINEDSIRDPVKNAVIAYVNGLSIGENVLVSRLIDAAFSVEGVYDVTLVTPTVNVVVSDAQIAKTDSSNVVVS